MKCYSSSSTFFFNVDALILRVLALRPFHDEMTSLLVVNLQYQNEQLQKTGWTHNLHGKMKAKYKLQM
jgi:hypothetical protein